jgi:DNA-binding NtrC family response regulator
MDAVLPRSLDAELVSGFAPSMQAVNSLIAEAARANMPVLLTGESGTGKDVYARLLHRLSVHGASALKKISCAALEVGRFMEIVLGNETPDDHDRQFSIGSLFLDGVDELDLGCQRVLLTVLPDGEPKNGTREVSARLISTSSRDLKGEIRAGKFRPELYFRISSVCIDLPPLRERHEDIPALFNYCLSKHSIQLQKPSPMINTETMKSLVAHPWPGNIRELDNIARKMVLLGDTHVALSELRTAGPQLSPTGNGTQISSLKVATRAALRQTERELILKALERTHWNRKRAAQELQISYKSLLYKLKQIRGISSNSTENIREELL